MSHHIHGNSEAEVILLCTHPHEQCWHSCCQFLLSNSSHSTACV